VIGIPHDQTGAPHVEPDAPIGARWYAGTSTCTGARVLLAVAHAAILVLGAGLVGEPADSVAAVLRSIDLNDATLAKRVVELQRAAYQIEADLIGFNGIPPLHETLDDVQTLPLYWRGSFEDHILAGIIGWTIVNDVCDIDRLAVHPRFARRGHGRKLVNSLIEQRTITVSTGTKNLPARQLYESLGFIRTGEREIASDVTVTTYERSA